ncbi:autotransporter outer membrane beta-barrel domain-containing protein [Shewanella sp. JM162201]|uniref:Autotransporter outer membrane beta-barrel domain-containing protein n=1 Tax=Shewanella jiangmenensis TaxID=2837387 RepID=A0ABS5V399_9GAMM|nr:autotransporter outer membrane beta-barrel domain-containing protein [Shewanella jiangmenensis]MBT1444921.1 autotransporter outer membrane beta-barrel domain-containing protein [Shewanella jiangmenensis]
MPISPVNLLRSTLLASSVLAGLGLSLEAKANPGRPSPFSLQAAWVTTGDADVGPASLGRDMYMFDAKGVYSLDKQWSVGWSAGYDVLDFRWQTDAPELFRGAAPSWNSINRYNLGLSLGYRSGNWTYLVSPMLQYAWADTASSSDARSVGVVATAMRRFENGNLLGLGALYLDDIGESRALPFLALRWQLTDRLTLANPFDAGFSGPAGLELIYQSSPAWDIGLGSSRRSQRLLLTDEGQTVEIDEWVTFARLGWQIGRKVSLNAYAGWMFDGEMELGSGEREDIGAEGAAALSFNVSF